MKRIGSLRRMIAPKWRVSANRVLEALMTHAVVSEETECGAQLRRRTASLIPTCTRLLAFIGLAAAAAAPPAVARAWSGTTNISAISAWNDGHLVVAFSGCSGNNACGSPFFSLGLVSDPQQKVFSAIAFSAFLGGRQVIVSTNPGVCHGNQEVASYLQVNSP